jgi:predicted HicB family RNase H-like nuclease
MAQKKKAKAKPRPAAKSAKPAMAHKKMSVARKATRKAPVKHAAKATKAPTAKSSDYTKYSGKFTVRLPKSLHQALVDRADKEGVSLNLFVTNALSRTVAMPGKGKK